MGHENRQTGNISRQRWVAELPVRAADTDSGLTGLGEASLEWQEKTVETLIHEWVEDRILGVDPRDVERVVADLIRDQYQGGSTVLTAISGVEVALWDILGKESGQPVYKFSEDNRATECRRIQRLVRQRTDAGPVRRTRSRGGRSRIPGNQVRSVRHRVERPVAGGMDHAEARVKAVRDAVGPEVEIFIEVHGRLSGESAIAMGRRWKIPARVLQEPVSPYDLDLLKQVKKVLPFPIAAGERLYMLEEFARLTSLRAVDIAQPDLCHCGGLSIGNKIAALAQQHNILLASRIRRTGRSFRRSAFRLVHAKCVHARELFGI